MLKATKAYCYEEVRNNGKVLFIQSSVENGWWGYASPTSPPGFAPVNSHDLSLSLLVGLSFSVCSASVEYNNSTDLAVFFRIKNRESSLMAIVSNCPTCVI